MPFGLFQSKEKKRAIAEARQLLTDAGTRLADAGPDEALALSKSISANQSLAVLPEKEACSAAFRR